MYKWNDKLACISASSIWFAVWTCNPSIFNSFMMAYFLSKWLCIHVHCMQNHPFTSKYTCESLQGGGICLCNPGFWTTVALSCMTFRGDLAHLNVHVSKLCISNAIGRHHHEAMSNTSWRHVWTSELPAAWPRCTRRHFIAKWDKHAWKQKHI